MANKLKKMRLSSVDTVRRGANQKADFRLIKSEYPVEGAEPPTEAETNIFKQFLHWLRKNAAEAIEEPQDPIEKDYTTFHNALTVQDNHQKLWNYHDALRASINSILEDRDLDDDARYRMLTRSLGEYDEAMHDLFKEMCGVPVSAMKPEAPALVKSALDTDRFDEIEEVAKNDLDHIEEVFKFNDKHDPKTGRFAPKNGGGVAGGAGSGASSDFNNSTAKEFSTAVASARETCPEESRWRVTAHTQEELENDYPGAKLHVTSGGSTVAVTTDGDIISVCKNQGDSVRGKDLMNIAVENGGRKLDSFSGNHDFYCKCGFEPYSWTPFNEAYAPDGWRKGVDAPEPIVFYKYKGSRVNIGLDEFLSNTKPYEGENGYDEAMKARDKSMEG